MEFSPAQQGLHGKQKSRPLFICQSLGELLPRSSGLAECPSRAVELQSPGRMSKKREAAPTLCPVASDLGGADIFKGKRRITKRWALIVALLCTQSKPGTR